MIEIIVALIAVFSAVLPYLLQKNKELNLKIAEQKRKAYASFLKNFTEIAVAVTHDEEVSGKDADLERMLARDQLLLYASDEVIKAYVPCRVTLPLRHISLPKTMSAGNLVRENQFSALFVRSRAIFITFSYDFCEWSGTHILTASHRFMSLKA